MFVGQSPNRPFSFQIWPLFLPSLRLKMCCAPILMIGKFLNFWASQAEEKPCSGIFHLLSLKKRTGRSSCWCSSPCQSIPITSTPHIIAKSRFLWDEIIGQGSLKTIWGIGQRSKCWSGGDWEQTEVSWRLQAGRLLRRQVDIRNHAQLQDVQTRLFVCYITSVSSVLFPKGWSCLQPLNFSESLRPDEITSPVRKWRRCNSYFEVNQSSLLTW